MAHQAADIQEQSEEVADENEAHAPRPSPTALLGIWMSGAAIALAALYLVFITGGFIKPENRLGQMEVILFVAILVLNPSVISRLASLDVSSKGVNVTLNSVVRTQRTLSRSQAKLSNVVSDVQKQQEQQAEQLLAQVKRNIDDVKSLLPHFLPVYEIKHLVNLETTSRLSMSSMNRSRMN
jgi:hypothetical protein